MSTVSKYRALHEDTINALLQYFHGKAPEVDLYMKVAQALHVQENPAPATETATTPAESTQGTTTSAN